MASTDDVTDLRLRAQHLFALCDKEEKGFVTKRDMQRMKNEMPLEPEQLEQVFDSLDADGNGFLTFDEFIQGFGIYMETDQAETENETPEQGASNLQEDVEEDDEHFMTLLDKLGGDRVFEDESSVKMLWDHFRTDDPNATIQFEKFLERVSHNIHSKEQEKLTLEEFMKSQNETREEQMKRMYDEMEQQIKQEKELAIQTERMREAALKNELRELLEKKEQQIEALQNKEKELQEMVNSLRESDASNKQELAIVTKEKRSLESQLELQTRNVEDLRDALERLRRESVNERRQRAMAALSISESIAVEREGLVEQLHLLRAINTKLTDETDLRDYGNNGQSGSEELSSIAAELQEAEADDELCYDENDQPVVDAKELAKISNLMQQQQQQQNGRPLPTDLSTETAHSGSLFDELAGALATDEGDDRHETSAQVGESFIGMASNSPGDGMKVQPAVGGEVGGQVRRVMHYETTISFPVRQAPAVKPESWTTVTQGDHVVTWIVQSSSEDPSGTADGETAWIEGNNKPGSTVIADPPVVGYHNNRWWSQVHLRNKEPVTPSTVFKVIVIGDSGCGKTSFIRRFCCDDFQWDGASTMGIDLSVRSLVVGNDAITLQFWDTAGQERYRSITKQYLRRADAIIVMYDVTSEATFLSVRQWMESIKEVVEDDVVRVLVGNKTDLLQPEVGDDEPTNRAVPIRQVPTAAGMQLAEETGAGNFFETSAKTGHMIQACVISLAAKLQLRQDYFMEKIILDAATSGDEEGDLLRVPGDPGKKCCKV